ncbi:TPA: hypothetical protein ACUUBJ_004961 [Pseudomonas aeruginosa]
MDNITDWLTTGISFLALGMSGFALLQGRNSLSLYQGSDFEGPYLSITNNSPHAVTVIDFGVIRGDGRQSSITGEDGLKIRVEPRDSVFYRLGDDFVCEVRRMRVAGGGRGGLYVCLATDHRFYTVATLRRWSWWLRGWFDGTRRSLNAGDF